MVTSINGMGLQSLSPASLSSTVNLSRLLPEPRSRMGEAFRSLVNGVGAAATRGAAAIGGIDPQFAELLAQQTAVQLQMQLVSLRSNLLKSEHETEMAAIRNIRVG